MVESDQIRTETKTSAFDFGDSQYQGSVRVAFREGEKDQSDNEEDKDNRESLRSAFSTGKK